MTDYPALDPPGRRPRSATTRVPGQPCPWCGTWLDAASALPSDPDATPSVGDLTLCIRCGGRLIFGPGMALSRTEAGSEDPKLRELELALAAFQRRGQRTS